VDIGEHWIRKYFPLVFSSQHLPAAIADRRIGKTTILCELQGDQPLYRRQVATLAINIESSTEMARFFTLRHGIDLLRSFP
jgi:class 3 adenylate cyclase